MAGPSQDACIIGIECLLDLIRRCLEDLQDTNQTSQIEVPGTPDHAFKTFHYIECRLRLLLEHNPTIPEPDVDIQEFLIPTVESVSNSVQRDLLADRHTVKSEIVRKVAVHLIRQFEWEAAMRRV